VSDIDDKPLVVALLTFVGHADLVVVEGQTLLYTALGWDRRSRLALVWKAGAGR